jgi:hypothetical protein
LTAPRKRFEKREAGKEKQRPLLGKNKNSRSATQALTLLIAVRRPSAAFPIDISNSVNVNWNCHGL